MKKWSKFFSILLTISLLMSSTVFYAFAYSNQDGALSVGDVFYLGEYPQARVTDDMVIASLNSISSDWISYNYLNRNGQTSDSMKYKDVFFYGKKYRGVYFTEYRLEGKQSVNGYQINQVYWFEYKPIEWVLLNKNTGLALCNLAIDSQPYHHTGDSTNGITANNYEYSDIRNWLCNSFVSSAFNHICLDCIQTNIVNTNIPANDYVFLLSKSEADDLIYDLKPTYSTDYANCQGACNNSDGHTQNWCTRTAAGDAYSIYYMQWKWGSYITYYNWYDDTVWVNSLGVRPAIYVDVSKANQLQKEYRDDSISSERIITTGKKTNYYGALTYETSKAGEVQDAAIEFKEALELYFNAFCSEGQKRIGNTTGPVSLDELAKKLRKQDEAASDKYIKMSDGSIPSDCLDSIYYTLAHLLTNVVNSKVAIKIVNAVSNGMQALGNTSIKKGNYKVTFNIYANMWSAFAGSVKAEKVSGLNSGTTYIGEVDSTMAGTQKVLTIYMDCMSDIVKDACKYALFSILSELKSVTYIAEFEQKELEDFFANKVNILQKKGYGNVLALFLNVRAGYKVIKPFLIAKDTGSLSIVLNNAQSMYNTISEMSFSEKGINKKAVKEAVKTVEKARKKLANKLYNYIYNTNEPVEEEGFVGWLKNVFGIKCPVEFEIYDVSGDLIGYVDSSEKHEDYVWYTDDIYIELSGDSKFVYAPIDMELIFRFNAIDDGVMNYTIERQDGEERIDRLNYFDVPLSSGDTFEQCIPANTNLKAVKNLPLIGDSEINYDSYLDSDDLTGHINVTCEAENGLVIGEGPYPIGDLVTLTAIKDYDDYTFKGWFVDNTIVETSEIYRFTAKEDVSVKAVFEKKIDIDYSYTAEYADDYAESFCEVIKQQNNTCGVHIALPADKMNEVLSPKINLYNNSDELISSETYNAEATSENDILISGLVLDDIYRISVFDSNNELVATIIRNDSLLPQQIIPDKDELTLKVKDTAQISVLPMPVKSILSDVRWESLNPEIAQVDENGVVTGLHTGKTTVRCVMLNSEINCESEVTVYAETGDVDLDGHITISDVTAIQRYLAEFEPFSDEQLALADTNGDGEINITDATHLQLYLAEYDVVLGKP